MRTKKPAESPAAVTLIAQRQKPRRRRRRATPRWLSDKEIWKMIDEVMAENGWNLH
jgi:hypothetical protein